MYLLGLDIGSSSVKVSLINCNTGQQTASAYSPKQEMQIMAVQPGWAEQDPGLWWENLKLALAELLSVPGVRPEQIHAIGISYQMHGLVLVDKNHDVVRPSIIWCDSRAASVGAEAFTRIGEERCLARMLNSPGNFTASKLKWVKDYEPENFGRVHKMMLPGDYIAMKLTGEIQTTVSGLSEGILWDFSRNSISGLILDAYGFSESVIPPLVPTFGEQGRLTGPAARELGLPPGIPVTYRAGDQPNNALSLRVFEPGEVAATAGTSGVVYGVSEEIRFDPVSRVNTFAHVNHREDRPRLGVLLCINGTGILNAWLRRNVAGQLDYEEMNQEASRVRVGSEGLCILPFGNGAERMLNNRDTGTVIAGLNLNIHRQEHLFRAAQEGIAFSFRYGIEIMKSTGIHPSVIRAGKANMFLSPVFRQTLANITGAVIELYNTDGAAGAARGAGIGAGYYAGTQEAFASLQILETIVPDKSRRDETISAYEKWLHLLQTTIDT